MGGRTLHRRLAGEEAGEDGGEMGTPAPGRVPPGEALTVPPTARTGPGDVPGPAAGGHRCDLRPPRDRAAAAVPGAAGPRRRDRWTRSYERPTGFSGPARAHRHRRRTRRRHQRRRTRGPGRHRREDGAIGPDHPGLLIGGIRGTGRDPEFIGPLVRQRTKMGTPPAATRDGAPACKGTFWTSPTHPRTL